MMTSKFRKSQKVLNLYPQHIISIWPYKVDLNTFEERRRLGANLFCFKSQLENRFRQIAAI